MSEKDNYIITSRVRLARNLKGYPFTDRGDYEEMERITERVLNAMKEHQDGFFFYRLRDMEYLRQLFYVERHAISPGLVSRMDKSSFFLRQEGDISVMVGEEDHLRLQCILPGLALNQCYYRTRTLDKFLDERLGYAYDRIFGYLTACPTNVGTGLKASVMVHLPALAFDGMIPISKSLERLGLRVQGVHGEGPANYGSIFQISNERTIGEREETYLSRLEKIVTEVIDMEEKKRKELYFNRFTELEDLVGRGFGVLRHGKVLTFEEGMKHLSALKLGLDLSILKPQKEISIFKEMERIQSATLQIEGKVRLQGRDLDHYRARAMNRLMKEVF